MQIANPSLYVVCCRLYIFDAIDIKLGINIDYVAYRNQGFGLIDDALYIYFCRISGP